MVATLDDLDESALVDILTKPKNALVKQYQRLFEMEDVKLEFNDEAMGAIAHKAIARKTGARGLRSIMEAILLEPMFELPGLDGVTGMVINREVVEGRAHAALHLFRAAQRLCRLARRYGHVQRLRPVRRPRDPAGARRFSILPLDLSRITLHLMSDF